MSTKDSFVVVSNGDWWNEQEKDISEMNFRLSSSAYVWSSDYDRTLLGRLFGMYRFQTYTWRESEDEVVLAYKYSECWKGNS